MIASPTLGSIPAAFAPPPPSPPGCPNVPALGSFLQSSDVSASFTDDGTTATYFLNAPDESASDGIPGLIEFCVYPGTTPGPPTSISSTSGLPSGCPFVASGITLAKFAFKRTDGNSCNIPFDLATNTASPITMGSATWPFGTAPTAQTILMHINDAAECKTLYGDDPGTCWVFSADITTLPPLCNGDPACKQVFIEEADTTNPSNVPAFTKLHIHYTYVIVNQLTNTFTMIFNVPTAKTLDINSGGGKDYFGCEQIPDPSGAPGAAGTFSTYQTTGMVLKYTLAKGTCDQSRFTLTAPSTITLAPGDSITFTIDEITRKNKGMKQEYTSCGPHFLNSGFTVKWFQSDTGNLLHSFTTNPPLSVIVCPV